MISQLITAVGTGGSWVTKPFTAPTRGTVVAIQLGVNFNGAGGAGSDRTVYLGVFPSAPAGTQTTDVIGAGATPSACYAFVSGTLNELVGGYPFIIQNVFTMVKIDLIAGQQIHVAIYSDSSVHATVGTAVIQFEPRR